MSVTVPITSAEMTDFNYTKYVHMYVCHASRSHPTPYPTTKNKVVVPYVRYPYGVVV